MADFSKPVLATIHAALNARKDEYLRFKKQFSLDGSTVDMFWIEDELAELEVALEAVLHTRVESNHG